MVDSTGQLNLYNGALRLLGLRKLASLTENREPRRILDNLWSDGAVDFCLEQGQWKFAIRTQQLSYSPAIDPQFGYRRGFVIPEDVIRPVGVSADPYFVNPLLLYSEEAGIIYCDLDVIYYRYVSNDADYGNDYSRWPQSFRKYFQAYLAEESCEALVNSTSRADRVSKIRKKRLTDARSKDAMKDPTKMPPLGTWTKSRMGGYYRRNSTSPSREEF